MNSEVVIYTDGACIGNPGPGGYGVVLIAGDNRRELSGGYKLTTNNRMEIIACIVALESLKFPCDVTLYSDSQYVVNSVSLGWAKSWQSRGWRKKTNEPAKNPDLWERMLTLCEMHRVKFVWVKGHAGDTENEVCDQLSTSAARQPNLLIDDNYRP